MDSFAENYQKRLSWTQCIRWALRMSRVFPDARGTLVRSNPLHMWCGLGQDRVASLGKGCAWPPGRAWLDGGWSCSAMRPPWCARDLAVLPASDAAEVFRTGQSSFPSICHMVSTRGFLAHNTPWFFVSTW